MRRLGFLLIILIAMSFGNGATNAQEPLPVEQIAERLSSAPGEIHLQLFSGENRDGFMRLGWYKDGDALIVYDRSLLSSREIYETFEASMSTSDLSPKSISLRFHSGSAYLKTDMDFIDGHASGATHIVQPGVRHDKTSVNITLPDSVIFRAMSFIVPLVLPQSEEASFTYPWFAPMSQQSPVATVTLNAKDGGEIETASGPVETLRYELRGSTPENDIYITRGDSPEIVRIDVLGTDLKFLSLKE